MFRLLGYTLRRNLERRFGVPRAELRHARLFSQDNQKHSQANRRQEYSFSKETLNFKILPSDNSELQSILNSHLSASNVQLDDLQLDIKGQKLVVNLTWLRDSCHCPKCTHSFSRQRLFTPKDFKRHLFTASDVSLQENRVCVRWADGHESSYSLDWLREVDGLYDRTRLDPKSSNYLTYPFPRDDFYGPTKRNVIQPIDWSVSEITSELKPVDYRELLDNFQLYEEPKHINANNVAELSSKRAEAMLSLTHQLVVYGLAKIINVPLKRDQVLSVAKSLAYERPTGYGTVFDVAIEPSEEINLAYSSLEFDLHSDLTYREVSPGVQLLHCIRNSTNGGDSFFSDAFRAANIMRRSDPQLFQVLTQFPATFVVRDPYRNLKFRRHQPILSIDHEGNLGDVYYSPFMLPPVGFRDDVKLFYLALDKFTSLLQANENKYILKMEPGDLFIFHNRRVLHGRSSYDPTTSSRLLQGCYMDWDEIKCLNEKLVSHKFVTGQR